MNDCPPDTDIFAAIMDALSEIWKDPPVTTSRTQAYFVSLKDLPINDVQIGAARLMQGRTTATFPKPGEIREYALGTKVDIEDEAILAWADFERGQMAGPYKSVAFENALINDVVVRIGGWQTLCLKDTKERGFIRHEFIAVYKAMHGKKPSGRYLIGIFETENGPQYLREHPALLLKCDTVAPSVRVLLEESC